MEQPEVAPTARPRPSWLRVLAGVLFVLWVAVVAVLLTARLTRVSGPVGPGSATLSMQPVAEGATRVGLPPLGTVAAGTHAAPLRFDLRVDRVDVVAVRALAEEARTLEDVEALRPGIEDDVGGLLRRFALALVPMSLATGAAAAAVLPLRTWRTVGAGAGVGLLSVAGVTAWAVTGYDQAAFDDPTFEGAIEYAPQVLDQVRRVGVDVEEVRSRVEVVADKVADLYAASVTDDIAASEGETVLLHISDVHLNPIGLEVARRLAEDFEVDAVLDTGDTTSFGLSAEAAFVELLDDFPVPYLYVPGNHDGRAARRQIATHPSVTALDGEVATVGEVEVLGVADPTVTALVEVPREELDADYERNAAEVAALVRRERPDVLAVHNPVQAAAATGLVPVVAAGHLHDFRLEAGGGTLVTVVGSTGATGLGSLLVEADLPYQAQLLRFVGDELVAVDQISLTGVGGDFRIERRLVEPPSEGEPDPDVVDEPVYEPTGEELGVEPDGARSTEAPAGATSSPSTGPPPPEAPPTSAPTTTVG